MVLWLGACGPSAAINRSSVISEIGDASDAATTGGAGGVAPGSGGTSGSGGAGGTGGTIANEASGGSGGSGGEIGTGGAGGTGGNLGSGGNLGTGGMPAAGGTGGGGDAAVDTIPSPPDANIDTIKNAAPLLMVSYAPAGATSNLTNTGKLDWVHWGYTTATSVNRKKNAPILITMKKIGSSDPGHYDSRPATLSWLDGSPKTSVSEISDGIAMGDKAGVGFELRVTGNKNKARTLLVYLGGWQAKAKFTAQVGSSTETAYSNDRFSATDPGVDLIYTLTFQPTTDTDVLVVRWTVDEVLDTYGNVTVQAAALSE
jgi:hypothetical protein